MTNCDKEIRRGILLQERFFVPPVWRGWFHLLRILTSGLLCTQRKLASLLHKYTAPSTLQPQIPSADYQDNDNLKLFLRKITFTFVSISCKWIRSLWIKVRWSRLLPWWVDYGFNKAINRQSCCLSNFKIKVFQKDSTNISNPAHKSIFLEILF